MERLYMKLDTQPKRTMTLRLAGRRDILPTIALFLASRAGILGMYPFGLAAFAGAYDKRIGWLGLIAITLGQASVGEGAAAGRYLLSASLFWLYWGIFPDNKIRASAACGITCIAGALCGAAYEGANTVSVLLAIVEGIISAFLYIVFDKSDAFIKKRSERTIVSQEETISLCIAAGAVITGLNGFGFIPWISLPQTAVAFFIICMAESCPTASAVCGGLAVGFMCNIDSRYAVTAAGIFAAGALCGALLKNAGRFAVALGFLGGAMVAMMYASEPLKLPVSAAELSAASAVFAALPKGVHRRIHEELTRTAHAEEVRMDERMRGFISARLAKNAEAVSRLAAVFDDFTKKRLERSVPDAARIFDEVSERVCSTCPMNERCTGEDFWKTCRDFSKILDACEKCRAVPSDAKQGCLRRKDLISEFFHAYELYRRGLLHRGEMIYARDIQARQYEMFASLLNRMRDELDGGFRFRPDIEEEALTRLDAEGVSVHEINVIELSDSPEVYVTLDVGVKKGLLPEVLSDICGFRMELDTGAAGMLHYKAAPQIAIEYGIAALSAEDNAPSGDYAGCFFYEDMFYCILCDGMGTGAEAADEARMTAGIIKAMLTAGADPATAFGAANSAAVMKFDSDMYSTVDLLTLNRVTGACAFYKAGACASVVIRAGRADIISPGGTPAGMIPKPCAKTASCRLSAGDFIIMYTDGVFPDGASAQTAAGAALPEADNPQAAAELMLKRAARRAGIGSDDMSVVLIRLDESV